MNFLTEKDLANKVPSVFTQEKGVTTSDKYAKISTIDVLKGLQTLNFYPVTASESRCRDENNAPFVKHMVRLRNREQNQIEGVLPEIVLINSHNGLSSYQIRAGIYRLVCSNGLIVGNDIFCHRVKHQGDVIEKVAQSAQDIIEIFPEAIETVKEWKSKELNQQQQIAFAESSAYLKWEGESKINPHDLLRPRRYDDGKNDLWSTFNRVQENLIKGGQKYYLNGNEFNHRSIPRRQRTREVKSVSENARLNTALWLLAENLAKIA